MTPDEELLDHSRRALMRSMQVHDGMAEALTNLIEMLRTAGPDGRLSKDDDDLLKSHQKIIMTVLDHEAQLLRRRPPEPAAPGTVLDLDAARGEVARRLARLAAAAPAAGVS